MEQPYEMRQKTGVVDNEVAQEYEMLMNAMQVSVSKHLLDEHFTMIWGNDFYYKLIQYPKEEYIELFKNRPDIYYGYHNYEDELKKVSDAVVGVLQAGRNEYSIITRMPVKGGGHKWVRMNGIFTEQKINGYPVSYTVITDVNDLVEMQMAQSITYNNIPGFVAKYLIREHLQIEVLETNDRFAEFFGINKDSRSMNAMLQINSNANKQVLLSQTEAIKKGDPIHFSTRLQGVDGKTLWMQASGECVDWQDGLPVYLVVYIDVTDLTELREMQKKLEAQTQQLRDALNSAQRANDAKKDFLSRMSHEIRTPMNAIIGMTTIAAAHIGDAARIEDCLGKISFSSKHLLSLINDILDMSKIEDGKLTVNREKFSLQRLLDSVTTIIYPQASALGLEFRESLQDIMEEELIGDSMRVSQIILNLLSNAVKFTPEGGKVSLEVRQLIHRADGVRLRFTVSDTGRGMSREFLERLYLPFEQENAPGTSAMVGTGLGMSITKNLVNLLDGTISVKSEPGKGTTFIVELPFGSTNTKQPMKYPVLDRLKVLISDNNQDDSAYTSLLLEKFGITAKMVSGGPDAVEEIKRTYESGDNYDVCFIDWQMPEMDGIETIRRIRSIVDPELLIIIITAYDCSAIETAAREAGANLFLTKPFFASSLYNTLLAASGLEQVFPEKNSIQQSVALSGRRILLAEDNALNLEIAMEILKMAGADVICVQNGKEAINWFSSPEGRNCDVILMDIQMPGMDGYEATKIIRRSGYENSETIPIIAMTANSFREDVTAALEAGMNAHIAKPIDIGILHQTLEDVLTGKEA